MSADTVSPGADSATDHSAAPETPVDEPSNGVLKDLPVGPVTAADGTGTGIDLALVLAGVSAGITVQDAAGRILYANQVAAQLSGFGSAAEMLAASPEDLSARFQLLDEAGEALDRSRLPGRRVDLGRGLRGRADRRDREARSPPSAVHRRQLRRA